MVDTWRFDLAVLPITIFLYTVIIWLLSLIRYLSRHSKHLLLSVWSIAIFSSALSILYGWAFLSAFRTTIQAMSELGYPLDCSMVNSSLQFLNSTRESGEMFPPILRMSQIVPLQIFTDYTNTTILNATIESKLFAEGNCTGYFSANTSSTDFNNIFTFGLIPLFNYCGTDLWETYSGGGVLNPNFATIVGAPIGAFGMFRGGIKKLFPRHVRTMDWSQMDIAGSRKRFLQYKIWTRHYTHIDPTREFEGIYFRKEQPDGHWKSAGRRILEGFTQRPNGEYMHGTSDDLMHLGPDETVVTDETVKNYNAMLLRNGISSIVRSGLAISITIIPILFVRQLQDRQAVVDDTSFLVMEIWIGTALAYSVVSVCAGWAAFRISGRSSGDNKTEILVTYNQTGVECYRMGTYYCKGADRFQNGFHNLPFQICSFIQGMTSVLLSAVSALTLVSLSNAIIWIVTHGEWNRGLQTCLWLPSVFVIFYRFLFVLPTAREVDHYPNDGSWHRQAARFFLIPYYNWLARVPQLSGQDVLTEVVYNALKVTTPTRQYLGSHFLSPMRLSRIGDRKAVVKTTLHGGFYRHFPTKMLLETTPADPSQLVISFPKTCLIDGGLLETLSYKITKSSGVAKIGTDDPVGLLKDPGKPENIERIDPNATYLVLFGKRLPIQVDGPNAQNNRAVQPCNTMRAIRIPGEPWVSLENTVAALYINDDGLDSAPKNSQERKKMFHTPGLGVCVAARLPKGAPIGSSDLCPRCRVDGLTSKLLPRERVPVQNGPRRANGGEEEAVDENGMYSDDDNDLAAKKNFRVPKSFSILYRQHRSKPYALLSERRSGEVVARQIPGLLALKGSKLVCVHRIIASDPPDGIFRKMRRAVVKCFVCAKRKMLLPLYKNRSLAPATPDQVKKRDAARRRQMVLEMRERSPPVDNANNGRVEVGPAALQYEDPPAGADNLPPAPNANIAPDALALPQRHFIPFDHERNFALKIKVSLGAQHLDSRAMIHDWCEHEPAIELPAHDIMTAASKATGAFCAFAEAISARADRDPARAAPGSISSAATSASNVFSELKIMIDKYTSRETERQKRNAARHPAVVPPNATEIPEQPNQSHVIADWEGFELEVVELEVGSKSWSSFIDVPGFCRYIYRLIRAKIVY